MIHKNVIIADLLKLRKDWLSQRKELKNMMFSTDEKWSAERKKIKDLKHQYPFQPNNPEFLTTTPRIIPEKTMIQRDPMHMDIYHTQYQLNVNCPDDIMEEVLIEVNKVKHGKILTREDFAAYALLLANQHHLLAQFCQDVSNTDGIAEYIAFKVGRLAVKDKNFVAVSDKVKAIIQRELQEARHEKIEKRQQFNRTLAVDLHNDAHIAKLASEGFEIIEVDVKESQDGRLQIKKNEMPKHYKVIDNNAIVINKQNRKVLGILVSDKIPKKQMESIMAKLQVQESSSLWGGDSRNGTQTDTRGDKTKVNNGKQGTLGRLNFLKKKNTLTKTTKKSEDKWEAIQPLGIELQKIFKDLLPTTFSSVMDQTEELRAAGLCITPESPFSTVSINYKNAVRPHRDHNFHNYAVMTVYEKQGVKSEALTCFPELNWTDPNNGSQLPLPIAFKVGHLGVLIADTDYVHHVPEVTTERVSIVWYAYKDLMTPAFLLCEDSDLEDEDYEGYYNYSDGDVDMQDGFSNSNSNSNSSSSSSLSNSQGSSKSNGSFSFLPSYSSNGANSSSKTSSKTGTIPSLSLSLSMSDDDSLKRVSKPKEGSRPEKKRKTEAATISMKPKVNNVSSEALGGGSAAMDDVAIELKTRAEKQSASSSSSSESEMSDEASSPQNGVSFSPRKLTYQYASLSVPSHLSLSSLQPLLELNLNSDAMEDSVEGDLNAGDFTAAGTQGSNGNQGHSNGANGTESPEPASRKRKRMDDLNP